MKTKLFLIPMAAIMVGSGLFLKLQYSNVASFAEDTKANDELFLNADIKFANNFNPASGESETPIGIQASEVVNGKISIRFIGAIQVVDRNDDGVVDAYDLNHTTAVWRRGMFNKNNVIQRAYAEKPSNAAYNALSAGGSPYTVQQYNIDHETEYTHFVTYVLKDIPYSTYQQSYLDVSLAVNDVDARGILITVDRKVQFSYAPSADACYAAKITSTGCEAINVLDCTGGDSDIAIAKGSVDLTNGDSLVVFRRENNQMKVVKDVFHDSAILNKSVGDYGNLTFTNNAYTFFVRVQENNVTSLALSYAERPSLSNNGTKVTYGYYPQTQITDSTAISRLNDLVNGTRFVDYAMYAERAMHNVGNKYFYEGDYYVRLSAEQLHEGLTFESGTSITSGSNYWFKCAPIIWDVLEHDGNIYKIKSEKVLDAGCYYSSLEDRTIAGKTILPSNYEHSDLRAWLNNDFLKMAFSFGDSHIVPTYVDNTAEGTGPIDNQHGGNSRNTSDMVSLPSRQELIANNCGKHLKATDWAKAKNSATVASGEYKDYCPYWIRTPDTDYRTHEEGHNYDSNWTRMPVTNDEFGIVPMISVKIDSASTDTPRDAGEVNKIKYGYYPQTHVPEMVPSEYTDLNGNPIPQTNPLLSELNSYAASHEPVNDMGWYLYEGTYYVKQTANPDAFKAGGGEPDVYYFDDGSTAMLKTHEYWFKCEPIVWDVLENHGTHYLCIADKLLDRTYYTDHPTSNRTVDGKTIWPSNYEYSDVRKWLNNEFYNTAFCMGKEYITEHSIDMGRLNGYWNVDYPERATFDKVSLPYPNNLGARATEATEYLRAKGAPYSTTNNCSIYISSRYTYEDCNYYVFYDGSTDYRTMSVGTNNTGLVNVRPVVVIKAFLNL